MTLYILRRLIQAALILFGLSVVFFLLVRFQPQSACGFGDQVCVQQLNLDQPLPNQYLNWLGPYLHGDFGVSRGGQPVTLLLSQKLPPTALLPRRRATTSVISPSALPASRCSATRGGR